MSQITRDSLLNLATDANKAKGGLTAALRTLCTSAKRQDGSVDITLLAPLSDALSVGNADQTRQLRTTFGTVTAEVYGVRWGFKDGCLAPASGAGGRPAKTTEDKLRAFLKAEGWKATLDALYSIARQDADAARELLAVVAVLTPPTEEVSPTE